MPSTLQSSAEQNTKDTLYELLSTRLAAINPERTIVLRGITRPGVLVVENELLAPAVLPDCFRLSWSEPTVEREGPLPLVTQTCSIAYETAGTALNAGMDRGRALAAMDSELRAALLKPPRSTRKANYTALPTGGSPQPMTTSLWWGTPTFGKTVTNDDRLARTATVPVMCFVEAGER